MVMVKMLMEIDPLPMRGSMMMTMVTISPSWRDASPAEQLPGALDWFRQVPPRDDGTSSRKLPSYFSRAKDTKAAHATYAASYFGLVVTMDVYGYNLINGQVSTTTIIIGNLEDGKFNEDAIWVGWQRDAYRTTGCFDMECPGFEPARGARLKPGAVIDPSSHQKITIKVLQDRKTGDWWIRAGFNGSTTVIGRYPAKLFDKLSRKATNIAMSGVVGAIGSTPSPLMGSGFFPLSKAASITGISYIGEDGKLRPFALNTIKVETKSSCYSVTPIINAKFSYGGPGGCSARAF
uniref:Neprosin PEP catalytic domain-containing protein n=1 Tax=Aegilops tauschii TaxID=37682 RepID=M8B3H6_AEGTA